MILIFDPLLILLLAGDFFILNSLTAIKLLLVLYYVPAQMALTPTEQAKSLQNLFMKKKLCWHKKTIDMHDLVLFQFLNQGLQAQDSLLTQHQYNMFGDAQQNKLKTKILFQNSSPNLKLGHYPVSPCFFPTTFTYYNLICKSVILQNAI